MNVKYKNKNWLKKLDDENTTVVDKETEIDEQRSIFPEVI